MMSRRCVLLLAGLAPAAARAELADPLAQAVAANPALTAIARRDPAAARRLAEEAAAILAAPAPGLRSATTADAEEEALLRQNRLFDAVYRHDPAAALDLLTRVLQAGGQRR